MRCLIRSVVDKCGKQALEYNVSVCAVLFDYLYARLRYGFCGEDYFLNSPGYAMKNFQKADFFSHKRWLKARGVFNNFQYTGILQNKVKALEYFAEFIHHDWCYPKKHDYETFEKFIKKYNNIICKPVSQEGGTGVSLYNSSGNLLDDYELFKKNDILLEECIVQHSDMSFNNRSVNTIRVYTVLDKKGKAHILKTVLRAGIGDSIVDNFHSGGVIYPINVKRGFIESFGVRRGGKECIYTHPGTKRIMLGFHIPQWEKLKENVSTMAERLPKLRYVGWDMVVTPQGVDCIEANDNADHALFGRIGIEKLFWSEIKRLM